MYTLLSAFWNDIYGNLRYESILKLFYMKMGDTLTVPLLFIKYLFVAVLSFSYTVHIVIINYLCALYILYILLNYAFT